MVAPRLRKADSVHVQKTTIGALLGALALSWLLVLYMYISQGEGTSSSGNSVRGLQQVGLLDGATPVIGTLEKITSTTGDRHTELIYALPSADIKATALLLHGCYHHGRTFFSQSPSCETCIGLSENLRISRILMEQKSLAVLAVTSHDRESGCWSDSDYDHIRDALEYFRNEHHVTGPVLALGTSGGGTFGVQLAVRQIVDAVLVVANNLIPAVNARWLEMDKKPPIYFAPMPRDPEKLEKVEADFQALNAYGPVVLDKETCLPRPVDASFLNERVPKLSMASAQAIVTDLIQSNHIDKITGLLDKDPTTMSSESDHWREVLQKGCGTRGCLENQSLEVGQSPLAHALNRAWAFHVECSEVTVKALSYFEKELGGTPFMQTWHSV